MKKASGFSPARDTNIPENPPSTPSGCLSLKKNSCRFATQLSHSVYSSFAMNSSGIIYYFEWDYSPSGQPKEGVALKRSPKGPKALPRSKSWNTILGIGLLALSLGGLFAPMIPRLRLEAQFAFIQARTVSGNILASKGDALRSYFFKQQKKTVETSSAHTAPAVFNPLKQPDGSVIEPVDKEFGLIVPKIGVNAAVIPSVNPTKPGEYMTALENGIAHSSLSYFPNEDGTVYLFSHSTNYDWFVGDLNAEIGR